MDRGFLANLLQARRQPASLHVAQVEPSIQVRVAADGGVAVGQADDFLVHAPVAIAVGVRRPVALPDDAVRRVADLLPLELLPEDDG